MLGGRARKSFVLREVTAPAHVLPYHQLFKGERLMASIQKKIKKGRPYYSAVQFQRVNGMPRIVWQKYLGTIERIIERAEGAQR